MDCRSAGSLRRTRDCADGITDLLQYKVTICSSCRQLRMTNVSLHSRSDITQRSQQLSYSCLQSCLKLLNPSFSCTEPLRKSGLDRLDYRCDFVTQNDFREMQDPKHPLHYSCTNRLKLELFVLPNRFYRIV